jgi:hypothetical protein
MKMISCIVLGMVSALSIGATAARAEEPDDVYHAWKEYDQAMHSGTNAQPATTGSVVAPAQTSQAPRLHRTAHRTTTTNHRIVQHHGAMPTHG